MSYTIELVMQGGNVARWQATGDVPDGTFLVTGHVTPGWEELGVQRRDVSGRFAGAASHSHPIPEAAPVPAGAGAGRIPGEVPL